MGKKRRFPYDGKERLLTILQMIPSQITVPIHILPPRDPSTIQRQIRNKAEQKEKKTKTNLQQLIAHQPILRRREIDDSIRVVYRVVEFAR